uniref:WD_REPEATS_REGION domain-containing protein n=1 Tax=Syphacia muris TaxID=451379 RepID=A0A0N5AW87_9BILA
MRVSVLASSKLSNDVNVEGQNENQRAGVIFDANIAWREVLKRIEVKNAIMPTEEASQKIQQDSGYCYGSGISPRKFLFNELGKRCKPGSLLESKVLECRIRSLRESRFWRLQLTSSRRGMEASPVFSMDIDPAEQKYLLCGSCDGMVSIYDIDFLAGCQELLSPVVYSSEWHRYLVTRCQWYTRDSSMFVTSSMDKTVALWDTNCMKPLDRYTFKKPATQIHWCPVPSAYSFIAVANLTSNIQLIDPRIGEAIQNLRWKVECVSSVCWSNELEHILFTGGMNGNISIWDIRSGKGHLKALRANSNKAHKAAVGGIKLSSDGLFVVTMSIDRVIRIWNTKSMELLKTVKLKSGLIATPSSNPTTSFDIVSLKDDLYAAVPLQDDILIVELFRSCNHGISNQCAVPFAKYNLKGHLQYVNSCVFRNKFCEMFSAANDRSILIWRPAMDETLSDKKSEMLEKLQEDQWSDDD